MDEEGYLTCDYTGYFPIFTLNYWAFSMAIKIVICDDHQIILESLELLISTMENMEVVATFQDAKQVSEYLATNDVDVLITDLTMPVLNGIELTMSIREKNKAVKILMLTVEEDHQSIREAFNAGISGYVLKRAGRMELEQAITTIYSGQKYFSNAVLNELMNPTAPGEDEADLPTQLTPRELEIVKLIAKEFSSNEMAKLLFLSPGTIETHRHNIIKKLQVKNSIGIIKFALRHNLV